MHLFQSILNAHFLRYVTLVIVACFGVIGTNTTGNFTYNVQQIYANGGGDGSIPIPTPLVTATYTNEDGTNGYTSNGGALSADIDTTFIKMLNLVIAAISFLYVPFSMLSGWLLSPDWTFGDFIHLRPVLHSLWIFVSNTVYVVFAAMLIVVAIANIFGQSDSYAIKKMLPRFIIGVIMVPFTWWMVSATLSVSSYMTALVLRMPADMITASNSPEYSVNIPKKCNLDFTTSNTSKVWECDPASSGSISQFLKSDNAYGIIPLYAYNIFKFGDLDAFKSAISDTNNLNQQQIDEINAADKGSQSMLLQAALIATGLAKVGVQLFMSVLFALVFMIILIALVLVLFTRVIKMWMYAIFSPLFALRYFLSDKIDKDNAIAKFDFKEFIGLAMVPVVVSGALSFGFLFLMTFKTHMEQPISKTANGVSTQKGIDSQFVTVKSETNASSGSIDFFGIEIGIKLPEGSTKSVNGENADNLRVALLNVLSGLITPILGVIILWMAVMAAIKTSKVAGEAIKGIEEVGGMARDAAKKLPGMISIPGSSKFGKDGKNINFRQAAMMPKIAQNWVGAKEEKEREAMKSWMGIGDGIKSVAAEMKAAGQQKAMKMYTPTLEGTNIDAIAKNATHRANLQALAEITGTWRAEDKEKFDSGDLATVKKVMSEALKAMGTNGSAYGLNATQAAFVLEMGKNGTYSEAKLKELAEEIKNLRTITSLAFGDKKLKFNDNGPKEIPLNEILGISATSNEAEIKAAIIKSLEGRGVTIDAIHIDDIMIRDVKTALTPPAGGGGTP